MINQKETLFTISQFAALHKINKKTLMWYDEVGLFRPAAVKENGYRYYTYYQSPTLETILLLRELGVSIKEIKEFMEHRSARSLELLLEEKTAELDQTISRLKAMRTMMTRQKEEISSLLSLDLDEITIVERNARYLAIVRTAKDVSLERDIELMMKERQKYPMQRLYDASYGSMISVDNLYHGRLDDYFALFMDIPNPGVKKGLHLRPKGRYLNAYHKGNWDQLPARYEELLTYAREHHLALTGYSYERGINDIVIDSEEEYITQIEIQIEG